MVTLMALVENDTDIIKPTVKATLLMGSETTNRAEVYSLICIFFFVSLNLCCKDWQWSNFAKEGVIKLNTETLEYFDAFVMHRHCAVITISLHHN